MNVACSVSIPIEGRTPEEIIRALGELPDEAKLQDYRFESKNLLFWWTEER